MREGKTSANPIGKSIDGIAYSSGGNVALNPSVLPSSISPADLAELFVKHLMQEHNLTTTQIYGLIKDEKEQYNIPLSIFSERLSALETVAKYLSENLGFKNPKIAKILNRDVRTIWTTLKNAKAKHPEIFVEDQESRYTIPATNFADRSKSMLETLVMHLRDGYGLSFHAIALLLKRDDSTVWTVHSRAKAKLGIDGVKRNPAVRRLSE